MNTKTGRFLLFRRYYFFTPVVGVITNDTPGYNGKELAPQILV